MKTAGCRLPSVFAALASLCVIGAAVLLWVVSSRAAHDFIEEPGAIECGGLTRVLLTMRATHMALGAGAMGGAFATLVLWKCSGGWWLCSACAESPRGACVRLLFIAWAVCALAECVLLGVWRSCSGWEPARRDADGLVAACVLSGASVLFWAVWLWARRQPPSETAGAATPDDDKAVEATVLVTPPATKPVCE